MIPSMESYVRWIDCHRKMMMVVVVVVVVVIIDVRRETGRRCEVRIRRYVPSKEV